MCRTPEDRPRAIVHQNEVGDIDRQKPSGIEGMARPKARIKTLLFRRFNRRRGGPAKMAFLDEGGELWVDLCGLGGQRMIGGESQKFGAKERVGPGRINF